MSQLVGVNKRSIQSAENVLLTDTIVPIVRVFTKKRNIQMNYTPVENG